MDKMPKMPKRVSVEEADNGYMVSCYDPKGEKKLVCTNIEEVFAAVAECMGEKVRKPSREERIASLSKKLGYKKK
jgi:hypothetical protein